jgi:hypothetical protein
MGVRVCMYKSRQMLSSWHKPTSADAHSCLDTSQQTQIPAQLLIRADTRRNMQSLGYVHTHTRAYNQYMQMHTVTNSRRMQNNTCEIWESQHGWRLRGETWMKHGHILCCAWLWAKYADMQTFKAWTFFVSSYTAGFAQGTNTHFLSQRRYLCSNLEIIQGPAERSRIMKRQLKNTMRYVTKKHFAQCLRTLSWSAHSSMKSRRISVLRTEKV